MGLETRPQSKILWNLTFKIWEHCKIVNQLPLLEFKNHLNQILRMGSEKIRMTFLDRILPILRQDFDSRFDIQSFLKTLGSCLIPTQDSTVSSEASLISCLQYLAISGCLDTILPPIGGKDFAMVFGIFLDSLERNPKEWGRAFSCWTKFCQQIPRFCVFLESFLGTAFVYWNYCIYYWGEGGGAGKRASNSHF